ncbi:hypothetical protein PIB30_077411, partial [Stylosanthes scabra]|nr:hypothetical protein [Stylosanthes scabra]
TLQRGSHGDELRDSIVRAAASKIVKGVSRRCSKTRAFLAHQSCQMRFASNSHRFREGGSCRSKSPSVIHHFHGSSTDGGRGNSTSLQTSIESRHSPKQWKMVSVEVEQRWQVGFTEGR